MKRILEITNLASSAINFIGEQFSAFSQKGHEMHLICSPGNGIDEFCVQHGIHYHPVLLERRTRPLRDLKALWNIARYIKQKKIDVVICHQEKSRLLGTLAAWLLRVPVRIIYAHGVIVDTMHGAKKRFFIIEGRFVSLMAHKVICVSPSVMRRRIENGIDKPEKQVLIGCGTCNGVDTKLKFNPSFISTSEIEEIKRKFDITTSDFVIGFVGRIVRDKGVIELVKAFRLLIERHPSRVFKLLVIGIIEKSDSVPQNIIDFLESSPNVVFTGHIPHDIISKYYMLMNLVVLPSYREGFPTVILEAGSVCVPVVVSRSTGCIDSIVDGETGLYADIEPNDIADKIERFFNKDFALKIGKQARERICANYERQDVVSNTIEYFETIINSHVK